MFQQQAAKDKGKQSRPSFLKNLAYHRETIAGSADGGRVAARWQEE
jgi:hypothetical protein